MSLTGLFEATDSPTKLRKEQACRNGSCDFAHLPPEPLNQRQPGKGWVADGRRVNADLGFRAPSSVIRDVLKVTITARWLFIHKTREVNAMPSASSALTAADILTELKALGKESYKNILLRHGVAEPIFGVSIEELKKIQKRIKKDYQLALDLYDSGVYDAMYLAGLIADDERMTKKDLQKWADNANCNAVCSFTVAWVAAESAHGWDLGLKWIDSKKPRIAAAGWATLGSYISIAPDEDLDLATLKQLLKRSREGDSQGAGRNTLPDERLCHRRRLLCCSAERISAEDGRNNRQGRMRHGRHRLQSPLRPRLHPQSETARRHRKKTQDG